MDGQATAVGIAQITSGVINLVVMSLAWFILGTTIGGGVSAIIVGILTLGMCPLPIGALCGFVGLLPMFLGILEIVSGAVILLDTRLYKDFARVVALLEVLSIVFGGVCSVVVGAFVLLTLQSDSPARNA